MREHSRNPAVNRVPAGISEKSLLKGIEVSGYPLQGRVAHQLADEFSVIEEWGFLDEDLGTHRSLDVFAQRKLDSRPSTRPLLGLLIECKRSNHPHVFFQTTGLRDIPQFPIISGHFRTRVGLEEESQQRMVDVSPAEVLGLKELPFVSVDVPICSAFSKAVPKGKDKVDLSGADPYSHVILPLVKGLVHAKALYTLPSPQEVTYPVLLLAICVLDAPMVLVEHPTSADNPVLAPWVRVGRREAVKDRRSRLHNRVFAVDFVHEAFLSVFLADYVLPFAHEFAARSISLDPVFRDGGVVRDLDDWKWDEVRPKKGG